MCAAASFPCLVVREFLSLLAMHISLILSIFHFFLHQIIFQVFAAMDCEFIKYEASPMLPAGLSRTIGLFVEYDENSNECLTVITDSEDVLGGDPFFKTARSMMILSLIGAFGAGCLVLFEFFCCRICCAVLLETLTFFVSIVCGALVFLAYYNPFCDTAEEMFNDSLETQDLTFQANEAFECTFGRGSTFNVIAIRTCLLLTL